MTASRVSTLSTAVPDFGLSGRRALITGAGRGIGRACAEALAGYGAAVTLVSRTASDLEQCCEAIKHGGGQASFEVVDVTDATAVDALLAVEPPYDVVVNAAGISRPQPLVEVDEETLRATIEVNLIGAFYVSRAAVRELLASSTPGSIINISSQMGHIGAPERAVYCMTKHGIEGLTKAMAVELATSGIRVNTVAPTYIDTPMTSSWFKDPDFSEWVSKSMPMQDVGSVGDVTGAVVYLASGSARLVTGTSVIVDGGWTAQ